VADRDLEETESWPKFSTGLARCAVASRQVGSTGKLPESSVEYSVVEIFTRDRFGTAKRRESGYNNLPPPLPLATPWPPWPPFVDVDRLFLLLTFVPFALEIK